MVRRRKRKKRKKVSGEEKRRKKSKKKGFMVEWREWFPKRRKRGIVKEIRKR